MLSTVAGIVSVLFPLLQAAQPEAGSLLHPAPHEVDWTQPLVTRPGNQRLATELEARQRYDHAWELVRARDYDAALADFVWLWDATNNKESAFEPQIRHSIIASIGRIAPHHEPTRLKFTAVLDELEHYIQHPIGKSFREWTDWAELSRAMSQEERLVQMYERRRQQDGSIRGFDIHVYAMDDVVEVLLERKRFADVGRLEADIVRAAEATLGMTDPVLEDADARDHFSKAHIEESRDEDRKEVALLYATGLAAGRTAECERIAEMLLAKYDSVDARRALVLACLRVGVVPDTVPRWIGELEERGEDVTELEASLFDLTHP